jgi:hypothetical protein
VYHGEAVNYWEPDVVVLDDYRLPESVGNPAYLSPSDSLQPSKALFEALPTCCVWSKWGGMRKQGSFNPRKTPETCWSADWWPGKQRNSAPSGASAHTLTHPRGSLICSFQHSCRSRSAAFARKRRFVGMPYPTRQGLGRPSRSRVHSYAQHKLIWRLQHAVVLQAEPDRMRLPSDLVHSADNAAAIWRESHRPSRRQERC